MLDVSKANSSLLLPVSSTFEQERCAACSEEGISWNMVADQITQTRKVRRRPPTRRISPYAFQGAFLVLLTSILCDEYQLWTSFAEGMSSKTTMSGRGVSVMRSNTRLFASVTSEGFDGFDQERRKPVIPEAMIKLRSRLTESLRLNDFKAALELLEAMREIVQKTDPSDSALVQRASVFDDAVHRVTSAAFSPPFYNTKRILLGAEAMKTQLSSDRLPAPYNTLPKSTILSALRAVTGVNDKRLRDNGESMCDTSTLAFRFLQRLITGVGVRGMGKPSRVAEKEFCSVLNTFSNCGRMDMAHRVVALQERTSHAPPLSAVAYSILAKGYGRLGDLENVIFVADHATQNGVRPDTIMCNSLIDAYVNCNALDRAQELFENMKTQSYSSDRTAPAFPRPNRRTYNTMLKGLGQKGELREAVALAKEMESSGLWDAITTNSLVRAATLSGELELAEELLERHTLPPEASSKTRRHPNVEAYTELLDAYAKKGELEKALSTLQLMRQRNVAPNEVTFTCLISGLARGKKIDQAKKMLAFMKLNGLRPTSVTYNAFISALVSKTEPAGTVDAADFDTTELDYRVDEAMKLLRDMMSARVRPNTVTISVLVDAMGRCSPPRVNEASLLVEKLERKKVVPTANAKVLTALIKALSHSGDLVKAVGVFRRLERPDVVAINAFLAACCRCKKGDLARETFDFYFRKNREKFNVSPDVISYSTMISSVLSSGTVKSLRLSRALYLEMRDEENIRADRALVDVVLKGGLRIAQSAALSKADVKFLTLVIGDAERLEWEDGQLERRKRAVRAVLTEQMRSLWSKDGDESLGSLGKDTDDELFKRKGWNRVDSGFQLWGGGVKSTANEAATLSSSDAFLRSHGWNNVDSGFRIF